jgi:hypothetical protein
MTGVLVHVWLGLAVLIAEIGKKDPEVFETLRGFRPELEFELNFEEFELIWRRSLLTPLRAAISGVHEVLLRAARQRGPFLLCSDGF